MYTKLKLMGVSTASSLAMVASMAMPLSTMAVTSETDVVNSGDNANITANVSDTTVVTVTNSNTANTTQQMNATSNTGNNSVSGNIGGGSSIATGQALTQGVMEVEGNSNVVGLSLPMMTQGMSGQQVEVVNTGDNATVDGTWDQFKQLTVANTNYATTNQAFTGNSNTGYNTADGNIGGTGIQTGAAGTSAAMGVEVNENFTTVNGMGGMAGLLGSSSSLTNTGDDATLNSNWSNTAILTVANSNTAKTNQAMNSTANTGYNSAVDGIGGGSIMTGPAQAVGQFHVDANSNATGIAGWGGSVLGTMAELVNTGDNLTVNHTLSNTLLTTVASTNSSTQGQVFWHSSNSGYNYTDGNIGGTGVVLTNGASAGGTAHAEGNENTTVFGSVADVLLFLALGS